MSVHSLLLQQNQPTCNYALGIFAYCGVGVPYANIPPRIAAYPPLNTVGSIVNIGQLHHGEELQTNGVHHRNLMTYDATPFSFVPAG